MNVIKEFVNYIDEHSALYAQKKPSYKEDSYIIKHQLEQLASELGETVHVDSHDLTKALQQLPWIVAKGQGNNALFNLKKIDYNHAVNWMLKRELRRLKGLTQ